MHITTNNITFRTHDIHNMNKLLFLTDHRKLNVAYLLHSGLISRGEIFMDWIVKTVCGYLFKDYN